VHFINEKYNLNLPENEDHYDTLGGLILHYHQDFPVENEQITIGELRYTIKKMNEHQIVIVQVQMPDKED
jgi:CBS domain containing-hemolysin-like protein